MKHHWHCRFIELAQHIAQWSRDPTKKVGAVVARPDKTIASMGFNGFPRGVSDDDARYMDRELKNEIVVHAEMNAILHAREPLHGYYLYIWPFHPCARCAAAIVQAGIKMVVTIPWETQNWAKSIEIAQHILKEGGVEVLILEPHGIEQS